jgi:hypothetical protein
MTTKLKQVFRQALKAAKSKRLRRRTVTLGKQSEIILNPTLKHSELKPAKMTVRNEARLIKCKEAMKKLNEVQRPDIVFRAKRIANILRDETSKRIMQALGDTNSQS